MTQSVSSEPPSRSQTPAKKRYVQEKIMLMMLGIFVLGVLGLVFLPPSFFGPAMGLVTILSLLVMFQA